MGECKTEILSITRRLFELVHQANIPYCHFKSNEHVIEGMCGVTDLDILVGRHSAHETQSILGSTGFKRFCATPWSAYPAVEDYLGFDEATGYLVHIHLHYELTMGEKHLKGYRLPWDRLILSTRIIDAESGIYVADPHVEMLLLLLRDALKIRFRDYLLARLGLRKYFRGGSLVEYDWLKKRVQSDRVVNLAEDYLGQNAAGLVREMIDTRPDFSRLAAFRLVAIKTLHVFRTYGWFGSRWLRLLRELRWLWGGVNKRYLHAVQLNRRFSPVGGLLIVFLGADGAGKSTIVDLTQKWLSWKLDASSVYLGSGEGSCSLLRWPFLIALRILFRLRAKQSGQNVNSSRVKTIKKTKKVGLARVVWALVLSWEKRGKLRAAGKARNRGMVVIADRYPQNQVKGFNDGPLLYQWNDHPLRVFRLLAQWEAMPYRWAEMNSPDLVIKLNIDPKVAIERKPDMDIDEIKSKVEAVRSFEFPERTRVCEVDACLPLEDVSLTIKQMVWKAL